MWACKTTIRFRVRGSRAERESGRERERRSSCTMHRWNSNATVPNWRLIAHKLNMMIFRFGYDEFIIIISIRWMMAPIQFYICHLPMVFFVRLLHLRLSLFGCRVIAKIYVLSFRYSTETASDLKRSGEKKMDRNRVQQRFHRIHSADIIKTTALQIKYVCGLNI